MKHLIYTTALLLVSHCIAAQASEALVIGHKIRLYSKAMQEERNLRIYHPESTAFVPQQGKTYPVLYVLDGEAHFYATAGMVQQLSQLSGALPEMIVVGIENPNRFRDLVPSTDVQTLHPFAEFLRSELMPYIEKNYPTAPYKIIAGHSLGGLTVMDLLTKSPNTFNAYIAIDPSMWYAEEKHLQYTLSQFPGMNLQGKSLYLGIGNSLPQGMTMKQLKKDRSQETQHLRTLFKFQDFLKANNNGLRQAQKYYEYERHNTLPHVCLYDGLRFIFDNYFFDASEKEFADSTVYIANKLRTHYQGISDRLEYKNTAPEALVQYLAFDALQKKHFPKAKALLELNIDWYPQSSAVYESYANYHLNLKDTAAAIAQFKKAQALGENPTIANTLKALTQTSTPYSPNESLQKFAGTYTLVDFQLDIALVVRNNSLWAIVPGQADDEFVPVSEHVFTVRGKQGYAITFHWENGQLRGFTSVQPNGTFRAVYKHP